MSAITRVVRCSNRQCKGTQFEQVDLARVYTPVKLERQGGTIVIASHQPSRTGSVLESRVRCVKCKQLASVSSLSTRLQAFYTGVEVDDGHR